MLLPTLYEQRLGLWSANHKACLFSRGCTDQKRISSACRSADYCVKCLLMCFYEVSSPGRWAFCHNSPDSSQVMYSHAQYVTERQLEIMGDKHNNLTCCFHLQSVCSQIFPHNPSIKHNLDGQTIAGRESAPSLFFELQKRKMQISCFHKTHTKVQQPQKKAELRGKEKMHLYCKG